MVSSLLNEFYRPKIVQYMYVYWSGIFFRFDHILVQPSHGLWDPGIVDWHQLEHDRNFQWDPGTEPVLVVHIIIITYYLHKFDRLGVFTFQNVESEFT